MTMNRRAFVRAIGAFTCAGCVGTNGSNGKASASDSNGDTGENGGRYPDTSHSLDVHDERMLDHTCPVWVDSSERVYGRRGHQIMISTDWWETTEELYAFEDGETVHAVIVPENGRVLAGVDNRVELLNDDRTGSETVFAFDHGRAAFTYCHSVYEDIVVIGTYGHSDFEADDHANEVILSTNGGETFERILEAEMHSTDAPNFHIHDVEYDPYAERIWVSIGDGGNSQIQWSDDLGETWEQIAEPGESPQPTQIAAFEDRVAFGTDSVPEGIMLWERDKDAPEGLDDLIRPHVEIEGNEADELQMVARRRWHIREDGRELCLIPFGYSPDNDEWRESVVLASIDGDEWFELYRTEGDEALLTNVTGPVSTDGDRRTLVSASGGEGFLADATVPEFWG